MNQGWRREPARHALAAHGVKTGHTFNKHTLLHGDVPIEQHPAFLRASKNAYKTGHRVGFKGISDERAGPEGFDQITNDTARIVGHREDPMNPDEKWEDVHSYLWDDFWRGWREGFEEYREKYWD